jgi:hypothetical protein
MFDGCIVILLARLLALESRLDELTQELSPALRAMIGSDWKAGYDLFIATNPDVDASTQEKLRLCVDEYAVLSQVLQTRAAVARLVSYCDAISACMASTRPN